MALDSNQKDILDYMDFKNIGCFYLDSIKRWIWRSDIRENKKLSNKIMCEVIDIGNYHFKKQEVFLNARF